MKYRESLMEEIDQLVRMGKLLWSDSSDDELDKSFRDSFLKDNEVTLVSQAGTGELAGFALVSIRSDYVEGAKSSPVGYLEGIFVYPGYRNHEVGRHLLALGEEWCKEKGCTQMGSDTSITNTDSTEFHKHVGFEVTSKNTCFIKDL
jgi:aminoglycoside 6'-N-acetyltransferase I